jgi:methylglutaconyl-CoA hydratase
VEGYALGGGVGLVSVCDYVVAESRAVFSLSEVKVGLVPGCIGPFVLRKIGASHCRALFLSAERFDAERALRMGLVHQIASGSEGVTEASESVLRQILSASPQAVSVAKKFLRQLGSASPKRQAELAVNTLADIRVTAEAQEGLRAFLEKRPPRWKKT